MDSAGAVLEKYRYSPYGVSGWEGAIGFPFRFTGQKLDPETGLYYYKARYYDPETGRFLQTDPIGYEDQMNLYAYVGNDPVNATDPTGLECDDECLEGKGIYRMCTDRLGCGADRHADWRESKNVEGRQGQGNVGRGGGTFMDRPYGSIISSSNRRTFARRDIALDKATTEIRNLAKEHYPENFRTGELIPEFGRMIPEAGAEVIELPNGRFTYEIRAGRSDGRGNGSVRWRRDDPRVAARVHFHWKNQYPSRPDVQNAENQYNLRNQDKYYIESIGTFNGHRYFWSKGKAR